MLAAFALLWLAVLAHGRTCHSGMFDGREAKEVMRRERSVSEMEPMLGLGFDRPSSTSNLRHSVYITQIKVQTRSYLISLLFTIVPKASPNSAMTILVTSAPEAPGMSRSPTASSAIITSYPRRAASLLRQSVLLAFRRRLSLLVTHRAVVDTQTCAYTEGQLADSTRHHRLKFTM